MMRGPNGEEYSEINIRESRFAKVDSLAREKLYQMLPEIKKS